MILEEDQISSTCTRKDQLTQHGDEPVPAVILFSPNGPTMQCRTSFW